MSRAGRSHTEVVVLPTNNRVIRYKKDAVGNDLTTVLRWCETHAQPVWVFDDGSYDCPHTLIVEVNTDDHVIVDGPWEHDRAEGVTCMTCHGRGVM